MASAKEMRLVLEEALRREKTAEENCDALLHELRINGFHDAVEEIKNDEVRHQAMVKRLLELVDDSVV